MNGRIRISKGEPKKPKKRNKKLSFIVILPTSADRGCHVVSVTVSHGR
jgi:hypothetical protein